MEPTELPTHPERRECDHYGEPGHNTPCDNLVAHSTVQEQLLVDMHEIKRITKENSDELKLMMGVLTEIKEMVTAYKNIKGFIKTLAVLGTVAKWLTITGGSIGAIWYWMHNK